MFIARLALNEISLGRKECRNAFKQLIYLDSLPVIFTTAQLWVSSADLGQADLATGDINRIQIYSDGCRSKSRRDRGVFSIATSADFY